MEPGGIPRWLEGPADFGEPDPMTPLFDAIFRFYVTSDEPVVPQKFTEDDGSVYARANPDEFEEN